LQKETKEQNKEEEKEMTSTKKMTSSTDLPELHEVPMFEGMPLVKYDTAGTPSWNYVAIFALVSALVHSVKDIYRFSSKLSLSHVTDDITEQAFIMVDNRTSEIRGAYKDAINEFIYGWLERNYYDQGLLLPLVHLATVLLKMHKDLDDAY
jgi:uncharacterized protein YaaR (DUF327 family)